VTTIFANLGRRKEKSMKVTMKRSDLLMVGGAAATLFFSFFGFLGSQSAWNASGLGFATTVPALLALAMIGWYGCEMLGVQLPDLVLTFEPAQLKTTWSIAALGTMLAWATVDFSKDGVFWIQLLGTVSMTVGAVAGLLGKLSEPVTGVGQNPPPPPPPPPPPAAPSTVPSPMDE